MIIGEIGSGKSSLLYSILNEMTPDARKNPKIVINGSVAYSAQKPWIISGTLRQNILFGREENEERLKDVIKHACLTNDLKILTKGLET